MTCRIFIDEYDLGKIKTEELGVSFHFKNQMIGKIIKIDTAADKKHPVEKDGIFFVTMDGDKIYESRNVSFYVLIVLLILCSILLWIASRAVIPRVLSQKTYNLVQIPG